jgi:(R)-2-hydroxyacyl-CoA dehydratese activating ATPase
MFAGIDVGSLTAEALVIHEGRIVGSEIISVFPNPVDSARAAMDALLSRKGLTWKDLKYTISTGYGREKIQHHGLAQETLSEISCHGSGAHTLDPEVRTIIDIGGQDAKVIKLDAKGGLDDFVMNNKCAAGTGHFLEAMSRALGVGLEDLGPLAMKAKKPIAMSNRCTIYVETEVIHYLQRGASRQDVAGGITMAMADRVVALARRIGPKNKIMITGGVAKNKAVKAALEKALGVKIAYPSLDPQLIGAYGAAVYAARKGGSK